MAKQNMRLYRKGLSNMSKIWVTSDTHFGHDKDFIWGARGFASVDDMNEAIIRRWNSVVAPEDTVYLLGDVALNDIDWGCYCLKQLNGNINILIGNHDTDCKISKYDSVDKKRIKTIGYATLLKTNRHNYYLSHYPTITAYNSGDFKSLGCRPINLCGHTHSKDPFCDWDKGVIFHCELDSNNCYPWLLDDVIAEIEKKMK